jgi:hypothetical protein
MASDLRRWVELRGFEPLTPSMRTRCATRLRHSPRNGRRQATTGSPAPRDDQKPISRSAGDTSVADRPAALKDDVELVVLDVDDSSRSRRPGSAC